MYIHIHTYISKLALLTGRARRRQVRLFIVWVTNPMKKRIYHICIFIYILYIHIHIHIHTYIYIYVF